MPAAVAMVGGFWAEALEWDLRIWLVLAAVVSVIIALARRGATARSPEDSARRLLAMADRDLAKGKHSSSYALLTRSLRALQGSSGESQLSEQVRLRRARLLLARGFAAPCAKECEGLAAPEARILRTKALGAAADWTAAAEAAREALSGSEAEAASREALLGERQRWGEVDFVDLMRAASAAGHARLPTAVGPLRFESPKIIRTALLGRGRGVVAAQDIAPGELLLLARPIELLSPGDRDWRPDMDLEHLLAVRLEGRVLEHAQVAEETFSLFEGLETYGPQWVPAPWDSDTLTLPVPRGSGSSDLSRRVHNVVKHNAHRWPGKDPVRGGPAPGLGLWLWPPMVNHAIEADGGPNCAHIFVGDVMAFRATCAIRCGQEVLDRYSTPLAERFEWTLQVLREHNMEDAVYKAAASRWCESGDVSNGGRAAPGKLSESRAALMQVLHAIERHLGLLGGSFAAPKEDYLTLKACYQSAAAEARAEAAAQLGPSHELPLAPPEVRCLNLLCPMGMRWEGRGAALEFRAELVRRVALARPYHFAAVKLWAELFARFEELRGAGAELTAEEVELEAEVAGALAQCAAFWCGRGAGDLQPRDLREVIVPWARGAGGFAFGWFSSAPLGALLGRADQGR